MSHCGRLTFRRGSRQDRFCSIHLYGLPEGTDMHRLGLGFRSEGRPRAKSWLGAMALGVGLSIAIAPGAAAGSSDSTSTSEVGYYAPLNALPVVDDITLSVGLSDPIKAGSCTYQQGVDNAHFSSTGWAISSHGWWVKYAGTCPSKANVDIYLQAVWCDAWGCRWRTVDTDSKDVYAGGGSGKRATAREECGGSKTVGWRSFVDVDLIGQVDPSGYTYSTPRDLSCYPSS